MFGVLVWLESVLHRLAMLFCPFIKSGRKLLLSSNVGERGGSDKGRERPLGAVDLTVTDGGLFEGRGSNLGEVLKILEDIVAKGVDIADLDDVIEREVQKME